MDAMPSEDAVPHDAVQRCTGGLTAPVVLDAISHRMMRRWTRDLLECAGGCWRLSEPRAGEMVADAIGRIDPAVLVVDDAAFPECCQLAIESFPADRVIVVGPEPDVAYEASALARGAAAWLSRDHVSEALPGAVRAALHCPHDQCPPPGHPAALDHDSHATSTEELSP